MHIASSVALPMTEECEKPGQIDLKIGKGWFPRPVRLFLRGNSGFRRRAGTGFALIKNGRSIRMQIRKDAPAEKVCMFVFGTCLKTAMLQRGHLFSLHGSCLCRDGRAVLLTGPSGAGKSTLAAVMLKNGWRFMADDITFYRITAGGVRVISSCALQKLWKDAKEQYAGDRTAYHFMSRDGGTEKFYVSTGNAFFNGEADLALAVIMEKADTYRAEAVPEGERAGSLLKYLQPVPKPEDRNYDAALRNAREIARHVPVFRVERDDRNSYSEMISKEIESRI